MTPWRDGVRRVNSAPALVLGAWALTLLVTVPMAAAMRGMLADHLGASLQGAAAASGADYDWMQEFAEQASGLGVTFRPTIIGFGAVLDNLSAFMEHSYRPAIIVGAGSVYVLLWIFLAGGILDRYARDRATWAVGFFAACGTFFFRFLRLGAIQWFVYAVLFGSIHPLLFDRLYPRITHEVTVERTAFLARLLLYLVFGTLVAVCSTVFDYAKVRAIVEDRRSMVSAVAQAIGFLQRNYSAAATLFLTNFGLFAAVVGIYALVAPGAARTGISVWAGFVVGQAYVMGRLWVKLLFWASETALFQRRLAHAGYVNRPDAIWPDAPIIEAIR